jgi:hypothetical protein
MQVGHSAHCNITSTVTAGVICPTRLLKSRYVMCKTHLRALNHTHLRRSSSPAGSVAQGSGRRIALCSAIIQPLNCSCCSRMGGTAMNVADQNTLQMSLTNSATCRAKQHTAFGRARTMCYYHSFCLLL